MSELRDFTKRLGPIQLQHRSLEVVSKLTIQIDKLLEADDFTRRLEAEQNLITNNDVDAALEYVAETIDKQGPLLRVLRLLIIYSVTAGGIPPRLYESLRNDIFQTYGYQYLFSFNNLATLGLLKPQPSSISSRPSAFRIARKPLRLWNSSVDEKDPDDISYVYSGYAPLSIRLVEAASQWEAIADSILPQLGPHFKVQQLHPFLSEFSGMGDDPSFMAQLRATTMTLVVFIGGVASTEISALRFLSKKTGHRFIVATTKIITGDALLGGLIDSLV